MRLTQHLTRAARQVGIAVAIIAAIVVLLSIQERAGIAGRSEAAHSACMINLRHLAAASLLYSEDNDGRLMNRDRWLDQLEGPGPLRLSHHKGPAKQTEGSLGEIETYEEHCPCLTNEGLGGPGVYGYAFYSPLSEADTENFDDLIDTPEIFESTNLARNASDPFLSFAGNAPLGDAKVPRKNIAYLDGHVCDTPHVKLLQLRARH